MVPVVGSWKGLVVQLISSPAVSGHIGHILCLMGLNLWYLPTCWKYQWLSDSLYAVGYMGMLVVMVMFMFHNSCLVLSSVYGREPVKQMLLLAMEIKNQSNCWRQNRVSGKYCTSPRHYNKKHVNSLAVSLQIDIQNQA